MTELLKEIWSTSKRNKLRTTLTGFAVAWGIFMIIFLLGAGNGLINAQMQQRDERLSNSIVIFGGYTSKAHNGLKEGRPVRLDERDVDITRTTFGGHTYNVNSVLRQEGINISLGDSYISAQSLLGVYPADILINKRKMREGRFINDIDLQRQRKVVVLREYQARELSDDITRLVGKDVKVGNLMFKVVGIMQDSQNEQNSQAYTAYTTLKTIYGRGDEAGNIQFAITGLPTVPDNKRFETEYRAAINTRHSAAPDDENAIWIWNRYTDNIQMAQGISIIRTALWVIGLFTLLSGVVGVSNIMLITVKERTHEFGIRKALGAKPRSILWLVISESVVITTLFGYIGMVAGIGVTEWMDSYFGAQTMDVGMFQQTMFTDPTVDLRIALQATLTLIISGTLAGFFPARKATHIRPIEALNAV